MDKLVNRLKGWRKRNHLSYRAAAEVLAAAGLPIHSMTIYSWEKGRHGPGRLVGTLLGKFLEEHPEVKDPPVYGKKSKLSAADVAEIRRLRENGQTMSAIGTRFNVNESYISRIVRGERLTARG